MRGESHLLLGDAKNTRVMGMSKSNLNSCTESPVNGTSDREAHPKRWIAVLVQSCCEKRTAIRLEKAGYETYVPIQQEIHQWSDRKKKVGRLIMPMVVFVRATVREEEWLREQTYIFKLLAFPGSNEDKRKFATAIPDYQIERLKFLLKNAETDVELENTFKVGDTVRIISGPLKGLEGSITSEKGKTKFFIAIDFLGCASVEVSPNTLQFK